MRYYRHLYLGAGIEKKREKVIRRLEEGKPQPGVHIITLPRGGKNQLEIYPAAQFLQPDFPWKDFFVVGIGKGFDEALELVEEITKEVYNKTESADIRSYIIKKEQEE